MGISHGFRRDKRKLLVAATFFSFTCLFLGGFTFFEYNAYRMHYEKDQRKEIKSLQRNIRSSLFCLRHLTALTNTRLVEAHGNESRIQRILDSVHAFSPDIFYPLYKLPRIQRVSYDRRVPSPMTITRFGRFSGQKPLQRGTTTSSIFSTEDVIVSETKVLNNKGVQQGILTIELDLSEFKGSLGFFKTLDIFSLSEGVRPIQVMSFSFGTYPCQTLWKFIETHLHFYAALFLYMSLCLILLPFAMYYLDQRRTTKTEAFNGKVVPSFN